MFDYTDMWEAAWNDLTEEEKRQIESQNPERSVATGLNQGGEAGNKIVDKN